MPVVPQTETVVRTLPYVSNNSDTGLAVIAGTDIRVAFSVDVGQASQVDPDNAPTGWPGGAIETKYHAAYMCNLCVSADGAEGLLVQVLGAPHGHASMPIVGEWFVIPGAPLLVNAWPIPTEFSILRIANVGTTLAFGVFWEYHIRAAG